MSKSSRVLKICSNNNNKQLKNTTKIIQRQKHKMPKNKYIKNVL